MKTLLAIAIAIAAATTTAFAQGAPTTVSFAARLADNGTPIAGDHSFVFTLYDAATGGNVIWSETRSTITIPADGVLYTDLGTMTPLDSTVFGGAARFLEITLDGQVSDARVLIESVPYSLRSARSAAADNADAFGGHAPSFFQRAATNTCTGAQVMQSIDPATGAEACITPAGTTYTNGTGILLAGTTFSVDENREQRRVTGSCAATGAIIDIDQTGAAPTCLGATNGVVLSGTSFVADTTFVQKRVGACGGGAMLNSVDANGTSTCIAASTGLNVAANIMTVDETREQRRVSGTCTGAIIGVNADGTVACAPASNFGNNNTSGTTNANGYGDLGAAAGVGPAATVTVPASGNVLVTVTSSITQGSAGNLSCMGFTIGGNAASDTQALCSDGGTQQASASFVVTGLTAGNAVTFTAKYHSSGGRTATFQNRTILAQPLP